MKEKLFYNDFVKKRDYYQLLVSRIASIRLIIFFVMLVSFIGKYYYYPFILNLVFFVSLFSFVVLVFIHDRYYKIYDYYVKYVDIILKYVDRENGKWKNFSDTGSDYLKDNNYFGMDLDIFGDNSLYQFLSICQTMGGRDRLCKRLSNIHYSKKDLLKEQDAIMEVSSKTNFLIDFIILLDVFKDKHINLSKEFDADGGIKDNNYFVYVMIGIFCGIISISLLMLSLVRVIPFYCFYYIFIFNFI